MCEVFPPHTPSSGPAALTIGLEQQQQRPGDIEQHVRDLLGVRGREVGDDLPVLPGTGDAQVVHRGLDNLRQRRGRIQQPSAAASSHPITPSPHVPSPSTPHALSVPSSPKGELPSARLFTHMRPGSLSQHRRKDRDGAAGVHALAVPPNAGLVRKDQRPPQASVPLGGRRSVIGWPCIPAPHSPPWAVPPASHSLIPRCPLGSHSMRKASDSSRYSP